MSQAKPKGVCALCRKEYAKSGMSRHLASCIKKNLADETQKGRFYHLQVTAPYEEPYFLHLKIDSQALLEDLDRFLRQVWLECCGHMSDFFHQGRELDLENTIEAVFSQMETLDYEYDFGSTTELVIRSMGAYAGPVDPDKPVTILARNKMPVEECDECGNTPATQVCTECLMDGGGLLCEQCAKNHECGEDFLLPVVNSPRCGVCGFTGGYPEFLEK